MKLSQFDYELPKNMIATHPIEPRDEAKMLVLDKVTGEIKDSIFKDLDRFLNKGDTLVLNDTKVIPARLKGISNGRQFEVLLVKNIGEKKWETWVKPGRKAKTGESFVFSEKLSAKLISRENEIFIFEFNLESNIFFEEIYKIGEMPIPPYILKAREEISDSIEDLEDYQTVFASKVGSVAAPTASLHFTDDLLYRLKEKGINIEKVTLHVSLGTFQPVNTDNVEDFKIHSEFFEITPETAQRLNITKQNGGIIIAVGTTVVRVLETSAESVEKCGLTGVKNLDYALIPKSGETDIFIYPGYKYKFVDAIITNFHLPKSSLLMLVSAFSTRELIFSAYTHAINNNYRFYSYGDGMFIL